MAYADWTFSGSGNASQQRGRPFVHSLFPNPLVGHGLQGRAAALSSGGGTSSHALYSPGGSDVAASSTDTVQLDALIRADAQVVPAASGRVLVALKTIPLYSFFVSGIVAGIYHDPASGGSFKLGCWVNGLASTYSGIGAPFAVPIAVTLRQWYRLQLRVRNYPLIGLQVFAGYGTPTGPLTTLCDVLVPVGDARYPAATPYFYGYWLDNILSSGIDNPGVIDAFSFTRTPS